MPLPNADTETSASSEAAETFVNRYYDALNRRNALLPFYVNSSPKYAITADISINGAQIATPAEYYNLLEAQGNGVNYEAESFDVHVVNPSFQFNIPDHIHDADRAERSGRKMSVVVTVMGRIQYGRGREAPRSMFTECFVLVPNWDAMQRNPPRGIKQWLIMSQNFRAL